MNKNTLVQKLRDEMNLTSAAATDYVDSFFKIMKETLTEGESINIHNFGKFEVVDRAPKKGRNPQTGESLIIPPHKAVTFSAGKGLKDAVKVEEVKSED